MEERDYIEIISGKRQTAFAALLRFVFWCLQPAYWLGWRIDRWRRRPIKIPELESTFVMSIGNITTGGTGKTPMVQALAKYLKQRGNRPTILSRGFRSTNVHSDSAQQNDEFLELKWHLPDVPHLQSANRIQRSLEAVQVGKADCLLLDDGFQYRKLKRDLDLLLIDATQPFGFGYLLPRGLLREPLAQLSRADLICLTRCNLASAERVNQIEQEIAQHTAAPILKANVEPSYLVDLKKQSYSLGQIESQPWLAFAGIGNPENFFEILETLGGRLQGKIAFADHHAYQQSDVDRLIEKAGKETALVCTLKDLVKLAALDTDRAPIYALISEIDMGEDWNLLRREIESRFQKIMSS